jgi:hypothetical protein
MTAVAARLRFRAAATAALVWAECTPVIATISHGITQFRMNRVLKLAQHVKHDNSFFFF